MHFSTLGLDARLCQALAQKGYTQPTPVQQQAIPPALAGKDVMASAQTGTGKTAAFVLPCLQAIIQGPSAVKGRGPRVLVLTPTRELAAQVLESVKAAGKAVQVASGVLVGGVSYGPQISMLQRPLDVLVATPGRLIDHMNEGRIDFSRTEILVLDEADKMLDMGFLKPVEKVLAKINSATQRPQILLFSATFTQAVEQFSSRTLHTPARIALAPRQPSHTQITQQVYRADDAAHKYTLLQTLLQATKGERVIVFSATKYGSEKLAKRLEQEGYKAQALHGGMKQNARKRTLGHMHTGGVQVLVATDVAARGIDVKQLGHVINFDLPQVAEDYIHRIGRTGRAGETGTAISLVAPEDVPMLRDIEKILGKPVTYLTLPGQEPKLDLHEFNRQGAAAPRSRQKKKTPAPRSTSSSSGSPAPARPARPAGPKPYRAKAHPPKSSGRPHQKRAPKRP